MRTFHRNRSAATAAPLNLSPATALQNRCTSLYAAACWNHPGTVKLLISRRADVDLANKVTALGQKQGPVSRGGREDEHGSGTGLGLGLRY